jgi:glycine oxidase
MRVAVIGGGVMGCASALALASRGADVVLLERNALGSEASSAAAGVLGAQIESRIGDPLITTFARARAEYGTWALELKERTGIEVGHRISGLLRLASSVLERDEIARVVDWQASQGLSAQVLEPEEARRIEPGLTGAFHAAAWYPDESQVDPPLLLRALIAALAQTPVLVRAGAAVTGLVVEKERCVGVAVEGEPIRADAVVLAAGSWSSLVAGVPQLLPKVVPVRGQIVQLEERPPRVQAMVASGAAYLVPRGDGRIVCGSTMENVGFQRGITARGVHAILDGVLRAVPSLAEADVTSTWSGFRPFAGAQTAWLVGKSPLPGLFLATGHHRNGILLAKVTADKVAEAVCGGVGPS